MTPRLGRYHNSGTGERVRGWRVDGDRGEEVQEAGGGSRGIVSWLARGPPKAGVTASIVIK